MIDYLDFIARIDAGLQVEKLRIWRQLTLTNGRPIHLYAAGERGRFSFLAFHVFITYIKSAQPHEVERFGNDCLEYALKANQIPAHKQLVTSLLVLPCLATHTTYRELVQAAENTEKLSKNECKKRTGGLSSGFLQISIMPCLLNLTTHKSFFSSTQKPDADSNWRAGEEFLTKFVVSANAPVDADPSHR